MFEGSVVAEDLVELVQFEHFEAIIVDIVEQVVEDARHKILVTCYATYLSSIGVIEFLVTE